MQEVEIGGLPKKKKKEKRKKSIYGTSSHLPFL
jgi:hypothetical protein